LAPIAPAKRRVVPLFHLSGAQEIPNCAAHLAFFDVIVDLLNNRGDFGGAQPDK
jgi:hypothetical protein